MSCNRRNSLVLIGTSMLLAWEDPSLAQKPPGAGYADPAAAEQWMRAWLDSPAAVSGPFHMGKFFDRMYYMLEEISWDPSEDQKPLPSVNVPKGFVTDLTSIPRLFWSLFPPDGPYAFAAVIHDYLYWTHAVSREHADLIFKHAMQDLTVSGPTVDTLYEAVRLGGGSAWNDNRKRRLGGEKRFLRVFPRDPRVTLGQWCEDPANCS